MANRINPRARGYARRLILQALYQSEYTTASAAELIAQFMGREGWERADQAYFKEVVIAMIDHLEPLDEQIAPRLDRALTDLDPIEHAILRLGTWELIERLEIPYRVVIDQAVQLARDFGAQDSYGYINGVLDRLARIIRPAETGAQGAPRSPSDA